MDQYFLYIYKVVLFFYFLTLVKGTISKTTALSLSKKISF